MYSSGQKCARFLHPRQYDEGAGNITLLPNTNAAVSNGLIELTFYDTK